jgi:hypothetical protein
VALISLGLGVAGLAGKALGGIGAGSSRPRVQQTKISSSTFRQQRSPVTQKIPKTTPLGGAYGISTGRGSMAKNVFLMPQVGGGADESVRDILFDIKRLLVSDFQYRITKEQQETDAIRKYSDQKRRDNKERALEATKKLGSAAGNITKKVLAPLSNPLQGILGFLKNIFAGFLTNQALNWLSENKKKVENAFDWFRNNWEGVKNTTLAVLGGALLLNIAGKLLGVYNLVKSIIGLFGGKPVTPVKPPSNTGSTGATASSMMRGGSNTGLHYGRNVNPITGAPMRSGASISRFNASHARIISGKGNLLDHARMFARGSGGKMIGKLGLKTLGKFLGPILKRIPVFGGLINFGLSLALGESVGRAAAKSVGMLLGGALGSLIPIPAVGTIAGGILGDYVGGVLYDAIVGDKEVQKLNQGGVVRGTGPNRDSVATMLTPGEYVIRRKMAQQYLPFLDDLNYNGGKLYKAMYKSLKDQDESQDLFEKTNKKFDKALDKFMDFTNAGSSPFRLNKPSTPKPSAPALNKPGGSGGNLKPVANGGEGTPGLVVNPMLTSSSPQSEASSVGPAGNDSLPTYDPVDPSNPYIMYVMKEFGIMAGV